MTEPPTLRFLREELPRVFARGVEQLRADAAGGDARAAFELEDTLAARGFVRVIVEGEGEVGLALDEGELQAREAPSGASPRMALGVPEPILRAALETAGGAFTVDDRTASRFARLASGRAQDVIGSRQLAFHVVVEGVPQVGQVSIKVGIGHVAPPETPEFTVAVQQVDLEAARSGELDPRQLLWGGRVRFAGNYAPGLQLAMEVLQALPPPRRDG